MAKKQHILFIGGGNMTQAIVSGLIADGYSPELLIVLDRHSTKRSLLSSKYHVITAENLTSDLLCNIDVIVLSVKPHGAKEICLRLQPLLKNKTPLILSVMAGLTISTLNVWLGKTLPIVRTMPNTPALMKAGATGIFANEYVSREQKHQTESLMSSIGIIAWLTQETQIDIITALSGSGPAYFFLMIEAMQKAAIQLGLPEEIAKKFAIQTAYGSSKLALNNNESVAALRTHVTSKGGTTEAALSVLKQQKLSLIIEEAMLAAKDKSILMSQQFK